MFSQFRDLPFRDSPVEAFWGPLAARAWVVREDDGWLTVVFRDEVFARYRPQDDAEAQEYARGFNAALEACRPPRVRQVPQ